MTAQKQKESRQTYSFETHPMNGTNQFDGTSNIMLSNYPACVHTATRKER